MTSEVIRAMRDAWSMTKQRCLNPKQRDYHRYGGRGITICERWLVFENFLTDMGLRPEGMTLERLENNRGYEPGNCVWETRKVQSRNTERSLRITYRGVTRTLAEWSEITDIPYFTLKARRRAGYTPEQCIEKPVKCGGLLEGRFYAKRKVSNPVRGMAHHNVRISREAAHSCRGRWLAGESFSALSREFGVTVTTMSRACQGLAAYAETREQ